MDIKRTSGVFLSLDLVAHRSVGHAAGAVVSSFSEAASWAAARWIRGLGRLGAKKNNRVGDSSSLKSDDARGWPVTAYLDKSAKHRGISGNTPGLPSAYASKLYVGAGTRMYCCRLSVSSFPFWCSIHSRALCSRGRLLLIDGLESAGPTFTFQQSHLKSSVSRPDQRPLWQQVPPPDIILQGTPGILHFCHPHLFTSISPRIKSREKGRIRPVHLCISFFSPQIRILDGEERKGQGPAP